MIEESIDSVKSGTDIADKTVDALTAIVEGVARMTDRVAGTATAGHIPWNYLKLFFKKGVL